MILLKLIFWLEYLARYNASYEKAGDSGAFNACKEAGKLFVDMSLILAGGEGVARGAAKLTGKLVNSITKYSVPSIKGTQVGLRDPAQIDLMKKNMLNGSFEFNSVKGKIAGYIDSKGNYYISEGHHRMVAAQEIYKSTGDATYINKLLENGKWDRIQTPPADARPLPIRKK